MAMEWTRSETIALACGKCTRCHGYGLVRGRGNSQVPCECVLRAVFKACYHRFRNGLMKTNSAPVVNVSLASVSRGQRSGNHGWKGEEYSADFTLVCQRALTEKEYKLFRYAYLLGADWKLAHRFLKMSRPTFMQACYRLEAKLGRAFRECAPYSLFPLDEYFSPTPRGTKVAAFPAREPARCRVPLVPPIRKAA
jgi:hypothetical protein